MTITVTLKDCSESLLVLFPTKTQGMQIPHQNCEHGELSSSKSKLLHVKLKFGIFIL